MEELSRLKARISSLDELRNLVRALRALAASHLQEAQSALEGIRRYVDIVDEAIAEGAALLPPGGVGKRARAVRDVQIVITSQHGFAGAFNERLLDGAAASRRPGQDLVMVGQRGATLAEERGLKVDHQFPMATHVGGILDTARHIADYLVEIDSAAIVFGHHLKAGSFEVETRSVLPLDPKLMAGRASVTPPLHHIAPEPLLRELGGEYLFAEITRAVMESLASENGARLALMERAGHNIDEKLDDLRRDQNRLRQEAITAELLDVVTGSEAILSGSEG